jgi:hypothetical protein
MGDIDVIVITPMHSVVVGFKQHRKIMSAITTAANGFVTSRESTHVMTAKFAMVTNPTINLSQTNGISCDEGNKNVGGATDLTRPIPDDKPFTLEGCNMIEARQEK